MQQVLTDAAGQLQNYGTNLRSLMKKAPLLCRVTNSGAVQLMCRNLFAWSNGRVKLSSHVALQLRQESLKFKSLETLRGFLVHRILAPAISRCEATTLALYQASRKHEQPGVRVRVRE